MLFSLIDFEAIYEIADVHSVVQRKILIVCPAVEEFTRRAVYGMGINVSGGASAVVGDEAKTVSDALLRP